MPWDLTQSRLAYAFFMLLAAVVFVVLRRFSPNPLAARQLSRKQKWGLALGAFLGGVYGAKLPFVLGVQGGDLASLFSLEAWMQDGKTITTGLIGGYLGVEVAKLLLHVRVKTGDGWAIPLAAALGIGRWGCFCHGCCAGSPSNLPWAVDFGDGVLRHPTQLYESLFHLGMVGVLVWLFASQHLVLHRLQFYLLAYAVFRFTTEFIRIEPDWLGPLTFYQVAALVLGTGMILQWWWETRSLGNRI